MKSKAAKKANIRDLSYLEKDGKPLLKKEVLFRGMALRKMPRKLLSYFEKLPLAEVLDLRTPGEIQKKPDIKLQGVIYHAVPILTAETLGITHERGLKAYKQPPKMTDLYASLATKEESVQGLKKAFDIILDPNRKGPLYVHCTAGKDRCGVLMALLETALGFDKETIYADYELSDGPNEPRGRLYRFLIRVGKRDKVLAEAVYQAMRAKREYLDAMFDAAEKNFGSVDRFLREQLNVTPERIIAFLERVGA